MCASQQWQRAHMHAARAHMQALALTAALPAAAALAAWPAQLEYHTGDLAAALTACEALQRALTAGIRSSSSGGDSSSDGREESGPAECVVCRVVLCVCGPLELRQAAADAGVPDADALLGTHAHLSEVRVGQMCVRACMHACVHACVCLWD
eukprot:332246-Chlamydomonas_euryale.AAC.1